ncbi:MAG: hypothetical protein MUP22_14735 [Desulfobacterales bacterium]|nr:hypothetical protein [Desulfobacterales bacterium]
MNGLLMEQEKLILAGETLYGERWQSALTKALGLSDSRRIRQWITPKDKPSYRPIPPGVWHDIRKLLEERKIDIDEVLKKIEHEIESK